MWIPTSDQQYSSLVTSKIAFSVKRALYFPPKKFLAIITIVEMIYSLMINND